jgi:hypothetical protein
LDDADPTVEHEIVYERIEGASLSANIIASKISANRGTKRYSWQHPVLLITGDHWLCGIITHEQFTLSFGVLRLAIREEWERPSVDWLRSRSNHAGAVFRHYATQFRRASEYLRMRTGIDLAAGTLLLSA